MAAAVYGTTEFMVGLATNAHDDSANDSVTCMLTSCGQVADNVLIKVRRRTYALSRSTYNSGKDSSRLRGMIKRKREWHSICSPAHTSAKFRPAANFLLLHNRRLKHRPSRCRELMTGPTYKPSVTGIAPPHLTVIRITADV